MFIFNSREEIEKNENYQLAFEDPENKIWIWWSEKYNKIMYLSGTQKKAREHYIPYYSKRDLIDINHYIVKIREKAQEKKRRAKDKQEKSKELFNNINIGDIFYTSWGYNATYVDFFQVTNKFKGTVEIRQIDCLYINTGFMTGNKSPLKDSFISEPKKCRVNSFGITRADEYGHIARKTTANAKHYVSSAD